MPLQTSGAISISQARDEYGLGNPVSMSQFYGQYNMQSSGPISFSDFYGKYNYLDYQTVTVAKWNEGFNFDSYGFKTGSGTCSDGTSNIYGGIAITKLYWFSQFNKLFFKVASAVTNGGWTSITINGVTFNRTAASDFNNSSEWQWNTTTNPFGTTTGVQKIVTWR